MNQQGGGKTPRQRQSKSAVQTSHLPQDPPLSPREVPDMVDNRIIGIEHRSEMHIGPLPHPDILRKYDDVLPGSAERIFQQFEEEGRARREIMRKLANNDIFLARAGLFGGLFLGVIMIVAGVLIAHINALAGAGVIGTGVAAVLAAFYKGIGEQKDQARSDRENRPPRKKQQ